MGESSSTILLPSHPPTVPSPTRILIPLPTPFHFPLHPAPTLIPGPNPIPTPPLPLWGESMLQCSCSLGYTSAGIGHASRLRWKYRGDMFVPRSKLIPETTTFMHRFSCSERHPGLCFSRDSDIYETVLNLAASMERFFDVEQLFSFVHPV